MLFYVFVRLIGLKDNKLILKNKILSTICLSLIKHIAMLIYKHNNFKSEEPSAHNNHKVLLSLKYNNIKITAYLIYKF